MDHSMYELLQRPNAELWVAELQHLIDGKRNGSIEQLGSAAAHTEMLLRESVAPAFARSAFLSALDTMLYAWNSITIQSPETLEKYLSLIQEYTPKVGFTKIVAHLDRWGTFGSVQSPYHSKVGKDLHLQALVTLSKYVPSAQPSPLGSEPPYVSTYRHVLIKQLSDAAYAGFALGWLLMSGVASLETPTIRETARELAEEEAQAFQDALGILITPTHRLFPYSIAHLYECLLEVDLGAEFWRGLGQSGVRRLDEDHPRVDEWYSGELGIEESEERLNADPVIVLPDGENVTLPLSRRSYLEHTVELAWQGGKDTFDSLEAGSEGLSNNYP